MGVGDKGSIGSNLEVECLIDDVPFPFITSISFTHIINGTRKAAIEFGGFQSVDSLRVGSKISLTLGRGDGIHNLDFMGIIYEVEPKLSGGSMMAMDFISQLARSEIVEYKQKDIIGEDLYFLAAAAANYKDVNTDNLKQGSGIYATEDMDLAGLMTRKEFIDGCFKYMVQVVNDEFHEEPSVVRWRYAIRSKDVLDFFTEDPKSDFISAKMSVSPSDNNLVGQGLLAKTDTSRLVNSATFQSSIDSSIFATVTDNDSVDRHGVSGKLFQFKTTEHDRLEKLAYETVLINKEPTTSYRMRIVNAEHLTLGDYVEATVPPFDKLTLPVVETRHIFRDNIESYITLGDAELSITELIQSI